jgi:hypothetical protein
VVRLRWQPSPATMSGSVAVPQLGPAAVWLGKRQIRSAVSVDGLPDAPPRMHSIPRERRPRPPFDCPRGGPPRGPHGPARVDFAALFPRYPGDGLVGCPARVRSVVCIFRRFPGVKRRDTGHEPAARRGKTRRRCSRVAGAPLRHSVCDHLRSRSPIPGRRGFSRRLRRRRRHPRHRPRAHASWRVSTSGCAPRRSLHPGSSTREPRPPGSHARAHRVEHVARTARCSELRGTAPTRLSGRTGSLGLMVLRFRYFADA